MGGLSRRVAWVEKIRKEERNVLVVDSGDLLFRSVHDAGNDHALTKARLLARIYRKMDVSALNVGELDLVQGVELLGETGLPATSANIRSAAGGDPVFPPYRIRECGGMRVGFFGLIRPDVHADLPRAVRERMAIGDPVQAARDVVRALRGRADVVILLSDLGFDRDRQVAAQVPGIDFILGGHESHSTVHAHREGKTHIMQSWVQGMYVGVLRLTLEKTGSPFRDRGKPARLREEIRHLERSVASLAQARKATPSPAPNIGAAIQELSAQRQERTKEMQGLSPESYAQGNLFGWELVPLERSLPVDGEIQAWIREMGLEAGDEERIVPGYAQ